MEEVFRCFRIDETLKTYEFLLAESSQEKSKEFEPYLHGKENEKSDI